MSAPAPPVSVSAPELPVKVVPVAEELVTEKPLLAVAFVRFTTSPGVVRLAVPALELAEVAVQARPTVAVAVAPELTTRMSAPPVPRSVMVSVPAATVKVSMPVPPVRESLPSPPTRVSAPVPPIRVSAPELPVKVMPVADVELLTEKPLPDVMADRFTARPTVVRVAVPEFKLAEVAVQAAPTVAVAVAPELTNRMSAPPVPRSVIVSVPDTTVKVSMPVPPVRESLPSPPTRVSAPVPPVKVSAPELPVSVMPVAEELVMEKPLVVDVIADRFTANPALVRLTVPALELPEVAVHAALTVAFTVAPALTTTMSPSLRSVIVTVPAVTMNVSLPAPPVIVSLPPPPVSVSLPTPPVIESAKVLPVMFSAPVEPFKVMVSVPVVKVVKVQPAAVKVPPDVTLTTMAWVDEVPVTAREFEIRLLANWPLAKVAVDVALVLVKVSASVNRNPAKPFVAPALRSTATPAPAVPIWMVSVPASPEKVSSACTVPAPTMKVSFSLSPIRFSVVLLAV